MSQRSILPFHYPCVFYTGADMADSQRIGAFCVKDNGESVELLLMPTQGGTIRRVKNVRHITDPWHQTHPELSRQYGAWDYVDGFPLPYASSQQSGGKVEKKLQTAS